MKRITVAMAAIALLFTVAANAQTTKPATKGAPKQVIKKPTDPIPDKAVPYKDPMTMQKESQNTNKNAVKVKVKNTHSIRKAPVKSHAVKTAAPGK